MNIKLNLVEPTSILDMVVRDRECDDDSVHRFVLFPGIYSPHIGFRTVSTQSGEFNEALGRILLGPSYVPCAALDFLAPIDAKKTNPGPQRWIPVDYRYIISISKHSCTGHHLIEGGQHRAYLADMLRKTEWNRRLGRMNTSIARGFKLNHRMRVPASVHEQRWNALQDKVLVNPITSDGLVELQSLQRQASKGWVEAQKEFASKLNFHVYGDPTIRNNAWRTYLDPLPLVEKVQNVRPLAPTGQLRAVA